MMNRVSRKADGRKAERGGSCLTVEMSSEHMKWSQAEGGSNVGTEEPATLRLTQLTWWEYTAPTPPLTGKYLQAL